jgi:hypothetical protein
VKQTLEWSKILFGERNGGGKRLDWSVKIKARDDDKIHITVIGKGNELSSKPNRRKITMIFYHIHKLQLDLFLSFSTMPMAMSFLISHTLATAKKMIDAVEPEAKKQGLGMVNRHS